MKHFLRLSAFALFLSCTTIAAAQTAGPGGLSNGLVAWLQFDEQAGTRALDASGSGKAGQLVNGATWHQAGRIGRAVRLTTPGASLQIPLAWQPAAFSIGWWVYADGGTIGNWTQTVGCSLNEPDAWQGFLFHTTSAGRIYTGTDWGTHLESADNVFQPNSWQHFVFTFNRGEAALYKNGSRIAYRSSGMTLPAPWKNLAIGSTVNGSLPASGYYDDFRVYDRALSPNEVTTLTTSTASVYTPPSIPADDLDRNWSFSRSYDGNGNVIGEGKKFTDGLGRPTQAQSKSQTSGHVFATQSVYSSGGKPVLSTLAAPTNNTEFSYKSNFLTSGGTAYGAANFENANANNPSPADQPATPGSVGYYYSNQNTLEPLTATTNYPFSLVEEFGGPLGGTKRATGPGDAFRMGLGKEGKAREFPLLNELDHYLSLRPQFVPGIPLVNTLRLKGEKAVSINANGIESLSFSDADGKTLATCLSGPQYPGLTLTAAVHSDPANADGLPQYQDLHVPAAGPVTLSINGSGAVRVVNLLTNTVSSYSAPWPAITLNPGFYRVISDRDNQLVSYLARYGEFSYSYYDDGGRVVATIAPKGLGAITGTLASLSTGGRVGHWSFDEGTGLNASDASGSGLTATLTNQPTWNTGGTVNTGIPTSPAGGSSLVFNGQNSYVRVGDVPALRMSSTMSVEAWIYPTANKVGILLNKNNEYVVARFPDGSIQWAFWNANPGWDWRNTGIIAPLNDWSHIGITYNNGIVKAYLNGVLKHTYNGSGSIGYNGGEFWIGGRPCCSEYFQGSIDEVRVWNNVHEPTTGPVGALQYVTRSTYSGAGTLLATESTDEGRTEYTYAKDGRIRFSQSALQRTTGRFSYSNYDEIGRVVESGEYQPPTSMPPAASLVGARLEAEDAVTNGAVESNVGGASGGRDVGYLTEVGRYVSFTVSAPRTGTYVLALRYSAGADAGTPPRTMTLYVNGTGQQIPLTGTGAWTNWATQNKVVALTAGNNTVKVQMDAEDLGWINLDYVQLTDLTQGVVFENQLPKSTIYEAENASFQNSPPATSPNIATYYPGYHGAGFLENITGSNKHIWFTNVVVPTTGTYSVRFRYAAALTGNRTMALYVNWGYLYHAIFPSTGAWESWNTQTIDLVLQAGSNQIGLQVDSGGNNEGYINLDYLEVVEHKTPAANSVLALLEERAPMGALEVAWCSQRNQVWYDLPATDSQLNGRTQEFVIGAVAKTTNGTNTTWYSYDELGRVTRLVQEAPTVGVKTVDYSYDFLGNVLEVAYQKGQPDAFYHHYAYDADQRLRTVHTSTDGLTSNRTLQARYFYYLHGPLKRVEIANQLQGIDYAYTVQGWLKSINNSQRELDPGHDSPSANGTLKDLFGIRLDYFDGDFASRQLTAPSPYVYTNQNEQRFDGTVRASSWSTPAAATVHAYAHRYDAKGQLLESQYGQFFNGNYFSSSTARPYEEGNLSYDPHGNIQSLRRRDGAGTATDDFAYRYTANTNKLQAVQNPAGANVLSYEYDANGQMTRESEAGKGDKFLQYDVSGKVTGVYRNANLTGPIATYVYDDRGFRSRKATYDAQGLALNTTCYVTDAQGNVLSTYEQPAGQALQRTEVPVYGAGRLGTLTRLDDGTMDARYELNDQLGNARVIFHKPTTTAYQATMEPSQATPEERDFANVASTRAYHPYARTGQYVARVNPVYGTTQGPAKTLNVEKGDTLTFTAWTFAPPLGITSGTAGRNIKPVLVIGTAATGSLLPEPDQTLDGVKTRQSRWLSGLAAGLSFVLPNKSTPSIAGHAVSIPITALRYIFRDANGNVIEDRYVSASNPQQWERLQLGLRTSKAGTVEMTMYTTLQQEILFDDISVEQTGSAIVQEQHLYSYGSPLVGLNYAVGNKTYRHSYQGKYAEKDEETGYDSFELRQYNSRIGRWISYDPKGQFCSPYVGMGNNPVSGTDPDGGFSGFGPYTSDAKFRGLASMAAGGLNYLVKMGAQVARQTVELHLNKRGEVKVNGFTIKVSTNPLTSAWVPGARDDVRDKELVGAGVMITPSDPASVVGYHQTAVTDNVNNPRSTRTANEPFDDDGGNPTDLYDKTPRSFLDIPRRRLNNISDVGKALHNEVTGDYYFQGMVSVVTGAPGNYRPVLTMLYRYEFNYATRKVVITKLKLVPPSNFHLRTLDGKK